MTNKSIGIDLPLYEYLLSVSSREPELLKELREETAKHPLSRMQIAPEQGQFMALLITLIQAKKILEVGVFTGYSSLSLALALPDDGQLIACDVNEEYTNMARRYWQRAGVTNKIDLKLAPALETLEELVKTGQENSFDFMFIDADKKNYINYYEYGLKLVRVGGLIAIDNVLWSGRVIDQENQDHNTQAIREFNQKIHQDSRIHLSLVPIADGLTLAIKK